MNSELAFLLRGSDARVLIVSPHPDDEIIGAGCRLPLLPNSAIVAVTDGSPPNPRDALDNGFATRQAYAAARASELRNALALAGRSEILDLNFPDQGTSFRLPELTDALTEMFATEKPNWVITVPYEGGHPDHDSTAFAVHAACSRLDAWQRPQIIEMLAYHNCGGRCEQSLFLNETPETLTIPLSASERTLKRAMFDCFATQQKVLQWFPLHHEKFRVAPNYDFTQPPHQGQLYYEMFDWGLKGEVWRQYAKTTLQQLCLCAS